MQSPVEPEAGNGPSARQAQRRSTVAASLKVVQRASGGFTTHFASELLDLGP